MDKSTDIEHFIQNELKNILNEDITPEERKMLALKQTEYFIFQRLTSKKFRKNLLKEESLELIRQKIAKSVNENKPIYLIFAFGGYKNHWVADYHPNVEWAEFFHLMYLTKLLTPIAKFYKPGVFLEYESECEAGIYHNNQSKEDVDSYTATFKSMLDFMRPYVPQNMKFNYLTLPEQYDTQSFFKKVLDMVDTKAVELAEEHKNNMQELLRRPLFNLKLNGKEDLTKKSSEELNNIALRSLAFNHIFLDEDYKIRKDYFNGEQRIPLVGAYCSEEENLDNWITINACARSANAFWTSRGALILKDGVYQEHILGPVLYESLKHKSKMVEVKLFSGSLGYLNRIPVIEG